MNTNPLITCGCGIKTRLLDNNGTPFCRACSLKGRTCIRCNVPTPSAAKIVEGGVACRKCYQQFYKKLNKCGLCGEMSTRVHLSPSKGFPDIAACIKCRRKKYVHCASCQQFLYPAGKRSDGRDVCKPCLERGDKPFVCLTCGKEGLCHSKVKCQDCYWKIVSKKRFEEMVVKLNHEWSRDAFSNFYAELIARQNSKKIACVTLKQYFKLFAMLDSVFDNPNKITVDYLYDTFGSEGLRRHSISYGFLVKQNIIPSVPEKTRADYPGLRHQKNLLERAKGTWYETLMERFYLHRIKIHKRYLARGWGEKRERMLQVTITTQLRTAYKFLKLVTEKEGVSSIQELRQSGYDLFTKVHSNSQNMLGAFIFYMNRKEPLFEQLAHTSVAASLSEDAFLQNSKYEELVKLWINPSETTLKESLICLLILFYAQMPNRIVKLKFKDITQDTDGLFRVSFGQTEINLDRRIGNLLGRYLETRQALSMMEDTKDNVYLFPGRRYGHHMVSPTITYYLKKHGVQAPQLYATCIYKAFINGLRQPQVLVNALGISLQTAQHYLRIINPRLVSEINHKMAHA